MTRDDIKDLLKQIKIFYPRFESVEKVEMEFRINPAVIDAWHREIGYLELKDALKILDEHMESDDGSRSPGIAVFKRARKNKEGGWRCRATLEQYDANTGFVKHEIEKGHVIYHSVRKVCTGTWEDESGQLWAAPDANEEEFA